MAARHGTRPGYTDGCRCGDCKDAQRLYQRRYRERRAAAVPFGTPTQPPVAAVSLPAAGESEVRHFVAPRPVESGVTAELAGLTEARPGLAQVALAMARLMDNPRAVNQQPAAAKGAGALLDKLHLASARGRRGNLALVKSMTASSPAQKAGN
jgi:hypothetical protein